MNVSDKLLTCLRTVNTLDISSLHVNRRRTKNQGHISDIILDVIQIVISLKDNNVILNLMREFIEIHRSRSFFNEP